MRPCALLAGGLLLACSGDPGAMDATPTVDAGPPRVVLGEGMANFAPFAATGATAELVQGSQGGWHLWVSVRFFSLDPQQLLLTFETRDATGRVLSLPLAFSLTRRRVAPDGAGFVRPGYRLVFASAADPARLMRDATEAAALVGQDVTLWVEAAPAMGSPATDMRAVTIVNDVNEIP